MWNMNEEGFILGIADRAKVIARAGRRSPGTTHDGTRELITVIEAYGAKWAMLPPNLLGLLLRSADNSLHQKQY